MDGRGRFYVCVYVRAAELVVFQRAPVNLFRTFLGLLVVVYVLLVSRRQLGLVLESCSSTETSSSNLELLKGYFANATGAPLQKGLTS